MASVIATWPFSHQPCKGVAVTVGSHDPDPTEDCLCSVTRAVVEGIELIEEDPEVQTVGIHSFPNAKGVIQLDAALIELDGKTGAARFGGVMGLEGYRGSIRPAAQVLQFSEHTYLVGEGAAQFSAAHGLPPSPDPLPTYVAGATSSEVPSTVDGKKGHDTVGLIAFDVDCHQMAIGCSSSGMKQKHPGRVGDSPIFGSGLYGRLYVGGAVATGDGDCIATFPLSFVCVEHMKRGSDPTTACKLAVEEFMAMPHCPSTAEIGLCALNWKGERGGYCSPAWSGTFVYAFADTTTLDDGVVTVTTSQ